MYHRQEQSSQAKLAPVPSPETYGNQAAVHRSGRTTVGMPDRHFERDAEATTFYTHRPPFRPQKGEFLMQLLSRRLRGAHGVDVVKRSEVKGKQRRRMRSSLSSLIRKHTAEKFS